MFFCLPNVFADHRREIDLVKIEAEFAGDNAGRHGFAGAAGAGEKSVQSLAVHQPAIEAPVGVDPAAILFRRADFPQLLQGSRRRHKVCPLVGQRDLSEHAAGEPGSIAYARRLRDPHGSTQTRPGCASVRARQPFDTRGRFARP